MVVKAPGSHGHRLLDCTWQRSILEGLIMATGRQATTSQAAGRGLAAQQPYWSRVSEAKAQAVGWRLATQQPCHNGQGSGLPAHRQLDRTWQRSRATGSQVITSQAAGWGSATQQPYHGGQGIGQPWAQALGNATTLQWLQVSRQQPGRQLAGAWQPYHGGQG